eukprot:UC1_evm1s1322
MNRVSWLKLSEVQLPVLLEGERDIFRAHHIRVYDGDERTEFDKGDLTLTSHRLLWVESEAPRRALQLPLELVSHVETHGGSMFSSHKLHVFLRPAGEARSLATAITTSTTRSATTTTTTTTTTTATLAAGTIATAKASATAKTAAGPPVKTTSVHHHIRLSFRKSEIEEVQSFGKRVEAALSAKEWVPKVKKASDYEMADAGASRGFGVAGLLRVESSRRQEANKSIRAAFTGDLDSLMVRAKEMVGLLETYSRKLAASGDGSGSSGGGSDCQKETEGLDEYLTGLGIANPVTKQTAGAGKAYHRELARELAGFLLAPLERAHGRLALGDVYCIYNRARGSQLISPDDLVLACRQFDKLGLPLTLREYPSGVLIVQRRDDESDEVVIEKLLSLIKERGALTASSLASINKISAVLAKEQLLAAERAGALCRDETIEGLAFFPNIFAAAEK